MKQQRESIKRSNYAKLHVTSVDIQTADKHRCHSWSTINITVYSVKS